jgi:hypothetical protein
MKGTTKKGGQKSRSAPAHASGSDPASAFPAERQRIWWFGRFIEIVDNRGRHGRHGRFTPAQIKAFRREAKTTPVAELARRHGVSRQYMYCLIRGPKSPNPRKPGTPGGRWTAAEDKLVRTLSKEEAVARTGRSPQAVRERRRHLGVGPRVRHFTVEEDMMILRQPTAEVAAKTGRSRQSINDRRYRLVMRAAGANAGGAL